MAQFCISERWYVCTLQKPLKLKSITTIAFRNSAMSQQKLLSFGITSERAPKETICSSIYGINLWCRYPSSSINRLRVAYNNAYRILFNLPRRIHINETMVNTGISTFYSLMRKHTANFIIRCKHSPNAYIQQIFGSACFLDSDFSVHYSKLHLG